MGLIRFIGCLVLAVALLGICTVSEASKRWEPWGEIERPRRHRPRCPPALLGTYLLPADGSANNNTHTRIYFKASTDPNAHTRPVLVLIPGGPGLSHLTLAPLIRLSKRYDISFVDPQGVGPGFGSLFEPGFGNRFEGVIADLANAVHRDIEVGLGRDIFIVGHSMGGIYGGEAIARYAPETLQRVKGLVIIASTMTDLSYRQLCRNRSVFGEQCAHYQETKAKVFFPTPDNAFIERLYRNHFDIVPGAADFERARKFMDRDNFVQWILSHGALLWNDNEADEAIDLIFSDVDTCSPESVRNVNKSWGQDRSNGDELVTKLRDLQIPILSIIGGNDRLIQVEPLLHDALKMGAKVAVIPGASHFVFMTDLKTVVRTIDHFVKKNRCGD